MGAAPLRIAAVSRLPDIVNGLSSAYTVTGRLCDMLLESGVVCLDAFLRMIAFLGRGSLQSSKFNNMNEVNVLQEHVKRSRLWKGI